MADTFTGEIRMFGFDYAPEGWAYCDGSPLPIQQYPALYSILGIKFGGNGTTTFNLPNLQGVTPIGASTATWGQAGGSATASLSVAQTPAHNHTLSGALASGTINTPAAGVMLARGMGASSEPLSTRAKYLYAEPQANNTAMNANALSQFVGGSAAHENRQPYLTLNFCICLNGEYYPDRGD